jgi:hypothetical protein
MTAVRAMMAWKEPVIPQYSLQTQSSSHMNSSKSGKPKSRPSVLLRDPTLGKSVHVLAPLADEGDKCEDGLHVPNSALQQCRDSFIAADENHIKASRTHFSDTGLMGLLC